MDIPHQDENSQLMLETPSSERDLNKAAGLDPMCLQLALSCSLDQIIIVSRHLRLLFANGAHCKAQGMELQDMLGRHLAELLGHSFFAATLEPGLRRCLSGDVVQFQDWLHCKKMGARRMDILCAPFKNSQNTVTQAIVRFSDMTHLETEAPLHQAMFVEHFNRFYAGMVDACFYLDLGGRILAANPAAAALCDTPVDHLQNKGFARKLCTAPQHFVELLERLDKEESVHNAPIVLQLASGESVPCHCSLRLVRNPQGRGVGVEALLQRVSGQSVHRLEPSQYRLFLERRVLERTSELTRSNTLLQEKIVELESIKRELSEYRTRLRELASELSLVEQKERRRLAMELHDGVGQDLAMSRIRVSSLKSLLAPLGQEALCDELLELIKKMIDQSRCLIWELGSPELYELGLEAAIEELAEEFQQRHGLNVLCRRESPRDLPLLQNQKIMLFQMVRELLTNVVKHAAASQAVIEIRSNDTHALCSVSDNGTGFSPDTVLAPQRRRDTGFGLFSIRERLDLIGGRLEIHSTANGAYCLLCMPLQQSQSTSSSQKRITQDKDAS